LKQSGAAGHLSQAVDRWFTTDFIERRPDVIEERRQRILKNDPDSYKAAYEVLATSDLGDQLMRISMPTLVMTGENDVGSTPRMAAVIKERVPNCRLRIVPELKHSLLLEAPDTVANEIIDFLSS
jgi:pimeloyl-ACP methyl ester carboxylesterase